VALRSGAPGSYKPIVPRPRPFHPVRRLAAALALAALAATPARPEDAAQRPSAPADPAPDDAALAALAFALATVPAVGQLPLGEAGPGADGSPAIELTLEVAAREVSFAVPPRVRPVSVSGPRRATWRVERTNLPAHLQAGVSYRDVAVRVFLVATPGAFDVLVSGARRAAAGMRLVPAPGDTAQPGLAGGQGGP
jgi:hypothetical protein